MSFLIPIQAVPNQAFSLLIDEVSYAITLKSARGAMVASVTIDDVLSVSNGRFYADTLIIPYPYLEGAGGNFFITTEADALPVYTEFDVTQFLIYLTVAELADARS